MTAPNILSFDYQGMKGFRARMAGQTTEYLNPFQARSNSMCCVLLSKIPSLKDAFMIAQNYKKIHSGSV